MQRKEPAFTMGIEEEYLLIDAETHDLAEAPDSLMRACRDRLGDQVSPEFLQCQIEVGTGVCADIHEARQDLSHLRRTIAELADDHGLLPIAASCHPFSDWKDQTPTDKDRCRDLERSLKGVARRMLICGMHVHVGIEDKDTRIDLANQFSYFLPHLLALSGSSPFWQGEDTGLASYRLTVFDNLPRTGLPPRLDGWEDWQKSVDLLVDLDLIEDASKIWWDLRPSHNFPTLESRICDVCPRIDDTLALAALTQATIRMLWRLSRDNQSWRLYDRFLVDENRWRAQRYGTGGAGLIDFARGTLRPLPDLVDDLLGLVAEDAATLKSTADLARARTIARDGTSATRQRAIHAKSIADGATHRDALRAVTQHLSEEFRRGL
ncbi:MAG: carboxylate-amine ligase [Pseudomonadota bacterium]